MKNVMMMLSIDCPISLWSHEDLLSSHREPLFAVHKNSYLRLWRRDTLGNSNEEYSHFKPNTV